MLSAEAEAVGEFAGGHRLAPGADRHPDQRRTFILATNPGSACSRRCRRSASRDRDRDPGAHRITGSESASSRYATLRTGFRERPGGWRTRSSRTFGDAFETRARIFFLKLSSKFVLNAISVAGAVGILFLGGWLVLNGRSDVGTVMASLTGLARIERPGASSWASSAAPARCACSTRCWSTRSCPDWPAPRDAGTRRRGRRRAHVRAAGAVFAPIFEDHLG